MQQVLQTIKKQQEETLEDVPIVLLKIGKYHNCQRPDFIEKYRNISDFEIYQSAGLRVENWAE